MHERMHAFDKTSSYVKFVIAKLMRMKQNQSCIQNAELKSGERS